MGNTTSNKQIRNEFLKNSNYAHHGGSTEYSKSNSGSSNTEYIYHPEDLIDDESYPSINSRHSYVSETFQLLAF